jgi:predicted aspartyl protease
MGTFTTSCIIENNIDRSQSIIIPNVMVDTGSELSWISSQELEKIGIQREKKDLTFVMANGQRITRSVGFAIIRIENNFTIDEVVFAEEGDLVLLGARTMEGMNLMVDPAKKKLVASGPLPVAKSSVRK